MRVDEILKIGEILDIKLSSGSVRTKLQEFLEDNDFAVFQPTVNGLPIYAEDNQIFSLVFYRNDGVYTFEAMIKKMYVKDELRLCRFSQVTDIRRYQNRQAYRLPIVLDVEIEYINSENEEAVRKVCKGKTSNISEKSVQLTCFTLMPEKTMVNAKVNFDGSDSLILQAQVLRCTKPTMKSDPYEIVLRFVDCLDRDITYIRRFILRQQVKQNKTDR